MNLLYLIVLLGEVQLNWQILRVLETVWRLEFSSLYQAGFNLDIDRIGGLLLPTQALSVDVYC